MRISLALSTLAMLWSLSSCKRFDLEGRQLDEAIRLTNAFQQAYEAGRFVEACEDARQALPIWQKLRGPGHVDTAVAMSNLALVYYSVHDYPHADELFRRALQIYRQRRGPQHPELAITMVNLARVLTASGKPSQARPFLHDAYQIRYTAFGATDPQTLEIVQELESLPEETEQ